MRAEAQTSVENFTKAISRTKVDVTDPKLLYGNTAKLSNEERRKNGETIIDEARGGEFTISNIE